MAPRVLALETSKDWGATTSPGQFQGWDTYMKVKEIFLYDQSQHPDLELVAIVLHFTVCHY